MKNSGKKFKKLLFLLVSVLLVTASVTAIIVSAEDSIQTVGEMVEIKENFSGYLVQDTVAVKDDYVGSYQYTMYYDTDKGDIATSYFGTPIIVYTINHPSVERIGTDSNETIIKSMLDSGYVVIVLDFLNNEKAEGRNLELAAEQFRYDLLYGWGKVFTNKDVFPDGSYRENFLVPSGYNVLPHEVFWEIDKHSADGTFEKIVENWNSDFRATKGDKLVRWMHEDGTRKAVQNDFSENAPVWYDAAGNIDENGEYTYIKFTKAEVITDCVDPDGSFIDMNLYLHIVYPTNPENEVPVMALANSAGYPHSSPTGDEDVLKLKPWSAHFLYDGYAYAVFDYLWEPMARNASWGYYDGAEGVSSDHMNYSLHIYNDKLVNTAAMRYIRYTSLAGGDTFKFDLDKIGVYGNSKGGWFNFLGEKVVQSPLVNADEYKDKATADLEEAISMVLESFISDRTYNGYHGATRYSVGKTASYTFDGFTVNGAEKQPWLTYGGQEIVSGCQITVPENGGSEFDVTEGHMPIYVTSNMTDYLNAHYGVTLNIYNTCRSLDLPLLHLELPIGHNLPYGQDINHNVDAYDIFARFVNYYLKNKAISVAYVVPMNNAGSVDTTDKITIAFVGQADISEVSKITVTSSDGTKVSGSWESSFGGVVWMFTPDSLSGSTKYTVNIPQGFSGTNGTPMSESYSTSFITEFDVVTAPESVAENAYTFTAPEFTTGNRFVFRFNVTNDAANVAEVYAGSADGKKLGDVNLRGKGSYEIDVTDYIAANAGKNVTLVIKEVRVASNTVVKSDAFSGEKADDVKLNTTNVTFTYANDVEGILALGASLNKAYNYTYSKYYNNPTKILTYNNVTGGVAVTKDDLGRVYTFSISVYDTIERTLQLRLGNMTDKSGNQTIDYDNARFNFKTVANEWATYTFTYRVYESDYGVVSNGKIQYLDVLAAPDGDTAAPIYFSNLTVTENVTAINVSGAVIAETREGSGEYAPAVSEHPFAIYNGSTCVGEYDGWKAALAAYTSGYTIKLQSDYTLTNADVSDKLGSFSKVNLDLGSYTVTLANTSNSLVWIKATNKTTTDINVSGGMILIGDTPMISYESASGSGSGKKVSIDFTGVDIGLGNGSMATKLISDTTVASGVSLKSSVSFTDCNFDLPDAKRAYDAATVFSASEAENLNLSYTLTGGSLSMTSERWLTIVENVNSVNFKKDANGDYTSLVMPKSHTYPISGSYFSENGYVSYAPVSEENNIVTYEFTVSEHATIYGVIPEEYADSATYPFVLFRDGSFVSAHKSLKSVFDAASTLLYDKSDDAEAQILMRADHGTTGSTAASLGKSAGTIVFDLGGYTLTRTASCHVAIFETNEETPLHYKTSLLFKNGRIESKKYIVFSTKFNFATPGVKSYDVVFDNVTFGYASGTSKLNDNAFWSATGEDDSKPTVIETDVTFRNCTFDFKTNAATTVNTSAHWNFAKAWNNKCNVIVEGGTILGDVSKITLFGTDKYDTLTLATNEDGEYIKISEGEPSSTVLKNYVFDDGKDRSFVKDDVTGDYILTLPYEYSESQIPAQYADAQVYPFVIFVKENGEYVCKDLDDLVCAYGDYASVTTAIPSFYAYDGDGDGNPDFTDVVLLLRRDYTDTAKECNNAAMTSVNGNFTFDLGGHTIIAKKVLAFSAMKADYEKCKGEFLIKNGNILAYAARIWTNNKNDKQSVDKTWDITFENVKFGFAEGATITKNMFLLNYDNSGSAVMHFNVNFNNCTFDLKNNFPAGAVDNPVIFRLTTGESDTSTNKEFKYTVNINGGEVICDDLDALTFFKINSGSDTVTYDENVKFSPDLTIQYPFAVYSDGSLVTYAENWKDAMAAALEIAADATKSAEIVMRRDYEVYKAVDGSVNFNTARGNITLDLGGHTLTTVDGYFININISNASATYLGYESSFKVMNGTLINRRATLPSIDVGHSGKSSNGDRKTLSFAFENVTFVATNYSIIRDWQKTGNTGVAMNFVFDNCTFDFSIAKQGTVMFYFKSSQTTVPVNMNFVGGQIVTDVADGYTLVNCSSEDEIYFSKNASGAYTTLTNPTSHAAPTFEVVNGYGKTLVWVQGSSASNMTVYNLTPKSVTTMIPKVSLTLDRDLVYNVYVPANADVTRITLGGKDYTDVSALNTVMIGDESFYALNHELAAKNAAESFTLEIYVDIGGKEAKGKWTLGIEKYASLILDDANTSTEEKTLMKDILAYVGAAYTYFGIENAADVNARIEAVIGSDHVANNAPAFAGSAEKPTVGLSGVTYVLDATPTLRFALPDGADASKYTFFADGKQLSKRVSDDGKYIYIEVYAYVLSKTITYSIDGEQAGSFDMKCYYEYVKTLGNDNLTALVERFARYCESAESYRLSVTEN